MSWILRPTWHRLALCAGTNPNVFHPKRGDNSRPVQEVCRACAFRAVCIGQAADLSGFGTHGVWGGLTHQLFRRLRATGTVTTAKGDRIDWDAGTGTVSIVEGSPVRASKVLSRLSECLQCRHRSAGRLPQGRRRTVRATRG